MRLARDTKMPDNGFLRLSYMSANASGSVQSDSTPLSAQTNYISGADGTKGVMLPGVVGGGAVVTVINGSPTAALKVYTKSPGSGVINAGSASQAFIVPAGGVVDFAAESAAQFRAGESLTNGVTAGTVTASKVIVVDANKDAGVFGYLRGLYLVEQRGVGLIETTAGAVTISAAAIATGKWVRDPNGASRTDTFDTAANIVSAFRGATVGDEFRFKIINNADAAETLTISGTTSVTFVASQRTHTIAQNGDHEYILRLTNVTSGAEAVAIYD